MNDDVRNEHLPVAAESTNDPLRPFRIGRRAVLQSLATGVGAAVFVPHASAAHVHQAAATAAAPAGAARTTTAESGLLFFDRHAFDTVALLSEQIVPGSRAAQVPEFLDRLLAVESTDSQKRFTQALGTFERAAREAHGKPWKALTEAEANALLTKMSQLPDSDATRHVFDGLKGFLAEIYFESEAGKKELGWNGGVAFAPPAGCA